MSRVKPISFSLPPKYYDRIIFVVFAAVIGACIIDTSFNRINSFSSSLQAFSDWVLVVFSVLVGVYIMGQYLILHFVKMKSKQIRTKQQLRLDETHKIVTIVQYALTGILALVVLEMIVLSHYDVFMEAMAVAISYALAAIMLGLLSRRFFSWFSSNRNSVVLLFGLSSAMLAVNAALTLAFVDVILFNLPSYEHPHVGASSAPFIGPGSAADILNYPYVISSIVSFATIWIGTILLLRGHSVRFGRSGYWSIVSIPLAYFISQFLPLFPNLLSLFPQSAATIFFVYTLIFTLSKPAGGILFGVAFWTLARKMGDNKAVRDYLILSAYGMVLLFVSNQAIVLVHLSYPPFGLVTILFMGLSSYLILVGIYSSAISVAEDQQIRKEIRQTAVILLDSIGTAQMEQQIENKVAIITKRFQDTIIEESGIASSIDDMAIQQYTRQVVEEISLHRKKHDEQSQENSTNENP